MWLYRLSLHCDYEGPGVRCITRFSPHVKIEVQPLPQNVAKIQPITKRTSSLNLRRLAREGGECNVCLIQSVDSLNVSIFKGARYKSRCCYRLRERGFLSPLFLSCKTFYDADNWSFFISLVSYE